MIQFLRSSCLGTLDMHDEQFKSSQLEKCHDVKEPRTEYFSAGTTFLRENSVFFFCMKLFVSIREFDLNEFSEYLN